MQRKLAVLPSAWLGALLAMSLASLARAQEMPLEYREVLDRLGKKGDYKEGVLKVNIPRNDLKVTVAGLAVPTAFGFGGWVAMTKGDGGKDVLMGDLVLLEGEVWPVMSALLKNGLQVTALHNHFFWDQPRIAYMHVHGYGSAADLARRLKPALDLIGRPGSSSADPAASTAAQAPQAKPAFDTDKIAQSIGHQGEHFGAVYKITVGRSDLVVKDMGARVNSRMGLNTWAAFVGTDEQAAVAGDVAMLESEVTPVLKALVKNNLMVVAIHQHMIGVRPEIIFLHYWGQGPVEQLARGFRAALDELGKSKPAGMAHH